MTIFVLPSSLTFLAQTSVFLHEIFWSFWQTMGDMSLTWSSSGSLRVRRKLLPPCLFEPSQAARLAECFGNVLGLMAWRLGLQIMWL